MSKFASCLHHLRDPAIGHRHQRTRAATVALSPTASAASPVRMAPRAVRFTLANPARSFAATRQPLWYCSAQATTAETPEPPGRI